MYAKSWVVVEGFTVTRAESRGICLQNACTNITVARNHQSLSGDIGIQGVGGSGLVLEENVASDNLGHGIALIGGATGCTLRDNECFGNADPNARLANGIYLFNAPANTLCRNRLHHNQDSGMHLQSGSNDCVAFNNVSWSNGDHGFDHLYATGTTHACDVSYGNYRDGFSIEGYASGTHLHDCVAVENGLTTNRYDLWVDLNSTVGFESDYNVFWNSTAQSPVKYVTTPYATVAAYAAASGHDANTFQADPRFVNGGAGDFHLRLDSPAIDSGDSGAPGWPVQDAAGMTREDDPATPNTGVGSVSFADRGAFERAGSALGVPGGPFGGPAEVFPNPVTAGGTLRFELARPGPLRVRILDLAGRVVLTLADLRDVPAGRVELRLTGRDDEGGRLGPGVYFYRIEGVGGGAAGRFVLVR
jgi:parallel beta-helix repeat protein